MRKYLFGAVLILLVVVAAVFALSKNGKPPRNEQRIAGVGTIRIQPSVAGRPGETIQIGVIESEGANQFLFHNPVDKDGNPTCCRFRGNSGGIGTQYPTKIDLVIPEWAEPGVYEIEHDFMLIKDHVTYTYRLGFVVSVR